MHIHQSIIDIKTGQNLFSAADGNPTPEFFSFLAGQQRFLPHVMCIMAPYVNSYRRLMRKSVAPINVHWGYDNRTVGLRVPNSSPAARRVENRLPGMDTNPYLGIAATLACGYLGLMNKVAPRAEFSGNAYIDSDEIPTTLGDALDMLEEDAALVEVLGPDFCKVYDRVSAMSIKSSCKSSVRGSVSTCC